LKNQSLAGKICAVTGANRGIGFEVARDLASMGAVVYLLCRNRERGQRAAKAIATATNNDAVQWMEIDLSLQASVHAFVRRFTAKHQHLDILVNNGATALPHERTLTSEGVETIFATNALGPYLLTKLLAPLLENTPDPPSRIICMASTYAGMLDVDDLFFMKRRYDNNAAYRQSMQVVRMMSKHFADYFCSRAQPEQRVNVVCNAVMPGLVQTKLLGDLGLCGGQVPTKGAATPTYMATNRELAVEGLTGRFFKDQQTTPDRYAEDLEAIRVLIRKCESILLADPSGPASEKASSESEAALPGECVRS